MIIIYGFALLWVTLIFYWAVMRLKETRDLFGLSLPAKVFAYPTLWVGLLLDFLTNVTICTVLFLELPKETLVTARLKRHIKGAGWRSNLAKWFCHNLLDTFDPSPNGHCGCDK